MSLAYGFVKAKIISDPVLKATRQRREIQHQQHLNLLAAGSILDVALNIGANYNNPLLKYKLVSDFRHPIIQQLANAPGGTHLLTGQMTLLAIDHMRSDIFTATGDWRNSDVMDGSEHPEPCASLRRLFTGARQSQADV